MTERGGLPILAFPSRDGWEAWLADRHAASDGVWLKLARKGSGERSVSRSEALEVALCYGWIDGQSSSLDARFWLQKYTPRRARSMWSKINRAKASDLIADGRMQPAGLREVERARADGRWEAAYDAPSSATVPDDLQRELDSNRKAQASFSGLDSRNRYAILHRIQTAKRPETRARRIAAFVAMLEEGTQPYPPREPAARARSAADRGRSGAESRHGGN